MSTPHDPQHNQPNQFPGPDGQGTPQNIPPQGYPAPQGYGAPQPGGPQQPHGQQPVYGQPQGYGPQAAHGQQAGHPGQTEPPRKKNLPLIIGAAVVALAVLGLGIAAAMGAFGTKDDDTSPTPQPSAAETSDGGQAAPNSLKGVVEAYLNALAKGDAKAALALITPLSNADLSLLTDEVLKDSLTRAPITDIQVSEPEGTDSPTVKASYKLGDEVVEDEYKFNGDDKKIFSPLTELGLHSVKKITTTVNGVVPKTDNPVVFPGSYMVASDNEYLEVEGELPILKRNSQDHATTSLTIKVSQAGVDMYRSKVIPEAEACLASKNLDPGCGMPLGDTLDDGTTLAEGSITRTQNAEAQSTLRNITPQPGNDVPTVITARDFGSFEVSATCTEPSGESGECGVIGFGKNGLSWPNASIDLNDPELKVIWEYQ
ncbi:MAG: hypothetical protein Q4D89_05180 [Arachnia propionica]|uniref:hypothetical protein n=1 Tax=Arachnia propionica TaxID=1750 RepID=UPI00270642A5|nr:hypothetical protein [Arachnia propionica]